MRLQSKPLSLEKLLSQIEHHELEDELATVLCLRRQSRASQGISEVHNYSPSHGRDGEGALSDIAVASASSSAATGEPELMSVLNPPEVSAKGQAEPADSAPSGSSENNSDYSPLNILATAVCAERIRSQRDTSADSPIQDVSLPPHDLSCVDQDRLQNNRVDILANDKLARYFGESLEKLLLEVMNFWVFTTRRNETK